MFVHRQELSELEFLELKNFQNFLGRRRDCLHRMPLCIGDAIVCCVIFAANEDEIGIGLLQKANVSSRAQWPGRRRLQD